MNRFTLPVALALLALVALPACLDFTDARAKCADKHACEGATPPTLASTVPAANATNVDVGTALTLTFSEPMDEASVKLTLSPPVVVQGPTWSVGKSSTEAVFTASAPLKNATLYTATVGGSSKTGVALADGTQFSFTTAAAADTTPPTLVSIPSKDATDVPTTTHLILSFSEAMNPSALSITTQPTYDWGTPTWDSTNSSASFNAPPAALAPNTQYQLLITATDVAGNALAQADRSLAFHTDLGLPVVVASQPAPDAGFVDPTTDISVTFSKPMSPLSTSALSISPSVSCTTAFDASDKILTCSHAAKLAYDTTYTVTVSTAAKDTAGTPLAAPYVFTFATGPAPDTTAPTLVSSNPLNNATGVFLDAGLTLTFSEPLDTGSFTLSTSPLFDWGGASWDPTGTSVSYPQPPSLLTSGTTYTVNLNANDLAGNPLAVASRTIQFQSAADTVKPTVAGTQPLSGQTGVGLTSAVGVTFSEAMQAGTTSSLTLSPPLSLTCTLDQTATALTCTHAQFAASTTYTATVATTAKDLAGNALASPFTFTFTTGTAPDLTPPTVVSVTPANNKSGVLEYTALTVVFSEAVDKASAQSAFAITSGAPAGVTYSYSWSTDAKTMTVNLSTPFAIGQMVNWRVTTAVKDLSGNAMATLQQFTFQVARQNTVTLYPDLTDNDVYRDATSPITYSSYSNTSIYHFVGDNYLPPDRLLRSPMTFDLASIPLLDGTSTSIISADLSVYGLSTTGNPYGSSLLGYLYADVIDQTTMSSTPSALFNGTLSTYTCSCVPFCRLGCVTSVLFAQSAFSGTLTRSVWYPVAQFQRGKITFLFNFSRDTLVTAHPDAWVTLYSSNVSTTSLRPHLVITYRYP
jgi:methionine-rich copper-binding protein CopC